MPIAASGRDLLVAVDVSGSMDFPDMQWQDEDVSRLSLVQHLLGDFLESRDGDRVGLILFGSQAYLQAPLTFDRHTVRVWLDEARIGIAGRTPPSATRSVWRSSVCACVRRKAGC